MYRDPMYRQHLERYVRHMVRFNVYLDAVVERKIVGPENEVVLKLVSCRMKAQ